MTTVTYKMLALLLTVASLVPMHSSAAETRFPRPTAAQEIWARTELYFGTNKDVGQVSDAEFAGFVDSKITPRFPEGLTLLTGYGQFLNSRGVLERERSKLLILFYPISQRDANKLIEEIRRDYKTQFGQESVLRVDSYALVGF
jgi:hypothetical protein